MKQLLQDNLTHAYSDREHVLNMLSVLSTKTRYTETRELFLNQLDRLNARVEELTAKLQTVTH